MAPPLLQEIDHVVVLMLENRSFDNILGHLYGLPGDAHNRYFPTGGGGERTIDAWSQEGTSWPAMTIPAPDPGEHFQDMNQQIFGLRERPPLGTLPKQPGELGPMGGFVQNYQQILATGEDDDPRDASGTPVRNIMNFFSSDQVPVSTALAGAFQVVDTYYASAPCQTMPNRSFAQLGTAQGFTNNVDPETDIPYAPYAGPTIFGQIRFTAEHMGGDVDWRVYFGDFPLTLTMVDVWEQFDRKHFRPLSALAADVAAGDLPAYTWIEPAYQIDPNDNHPPHYVTLGEKLLADVYNTLRSSGLWRKLLLVVTYDEHGGCFDRVFPPSAMSPGGPYPDGFTFDRYGVRVPTILCSPFTVDPSLASTGPAVYDHTSIIRTVRDRFSIVGPTRCAGCADSFLSLREQYARSFAALLKPLDPGHLGPESVAAPRALSPGREVVQQALQDVRDLLGKALAGTSLPALARIALNELRDLVEQAAADLATPVVEKLLRAIERLIPHLGLADRLSEREQRRLEQALDALIPELKHRLANDLEKLVAWAARAVHELAGDPTPSTAALADARKKLGPVKDVGRREAEAAIRQAMAKVL